MALREEIRDLGLGIGDLVENRWQVVKLGEIFLQREGGYNQNIFYHPALEIISADADMTTSHPTSTKKNEFGKNNESKIYFHYGENSYLYGVVKRGCSLREGGKEERIIGEKWENLW